jgi:poly [ADP-ribose] polymerase 2/3/4
MKSGKKRHITYILLILIFFRINFFSKSQSNTRQKLRELSGKFFTVIPHRIGRSKVEVERSIIDTFGDFEAKQELLQLMKDLLEITSILFLFLFYLILILILILLTFNGDSGAYGESSTLDLQYRALGNQMKVLRPDSRGFREVRDYVLANQRNTERFNGKSIEVVNIITLGRSKELDSFENNSSGIHPQLLLFHGSRISNWVGLLSRGILMPKVIVRAGGKRTDAGLLGNGIYFASSR